MLREFGYGVPDIERAILSARNERHSSHRPKSSPLPSVDPEPAYSTRCTFTICHGRKPAGAARKRNRHDEGHAILLHRANLTGKAGNTARYLSILRPSFRYEKTHRDQCPLPQSNSAAQAKDGTESNGETSCWLSGSKGIQAGSLHCDLWRGRAIELAGHDAIAVYPVGGWWKSHVGQNRVRDKARYSLIISISAPGHGVDLYSEISTLVENKEIEVLLG